MVGANRCNAAAADGKCAAVAFCAGADPGRSVVAVRGHGTAVDGHNAGGLTSTAADAGAAHAAAVRGDGAAVDGYGAAGAAGADAGPAAADPCAAARTGRCHGTAVDVHGTAGFILFSADSRAFVRATFRCNGTCARTLTVNVQCAAVGHVDTVVCRQLTTVRQDQVRRTGDGDAVAVEDFAIDYIPHAVFEGRGVGCDLGVGLAGVVAGLFHKFLRGIVPNQVGHRVGGCVRCSLQVRIRRFRRGQGINVRHKRLLVCGQVVVLRSCRVDLRLARVGVFHRADGVDQRDHGVGRFLIRVGRNSAERQAVYGITGVIGGLPDLFEFV